ncbi:glycosyltransferase family 4 protein [Sphingomonas arenae]|uniref:glycosyltransferase family 4 protein n=1 Tax=Sphingomonas arenae TaxID=2812555 RepID=UPI001967FF05|nr:glycosyltransferase family 4 protein [Sphingomonas arenae]
MTDKLSLYFYTGDFAGAVRRHLEGQEQTYATHGQLAELLISLGKAGYAVTAYSFMSSAARESTPAPNVRIVELGASHYLDERIVRAFQDEQADVSIVHFPHLKLLGAAAADRRRVLPVMATSYNRRGVRPALERFRLVRLLNRPKFRWVSNHCRPSTEHLAALGVQPAKLIPWDVPHAHSPADFAPKTRAAGGPIQLAYAGSVIADKGVPELLQAVAILRRAGLDVRCSVAGTGPLDEYRRRAADLGCAEAVTFLGLVENDQVVGLFRGADIVVVPSKPEFPEGFPLTMFEAIATRTPIVCSDHPMFRPVLRDGDNAAVFRAGDAAGLAAKVRQVLDDPQLYAALSHAADRSWAALQGPADWRTMLFDWVTQGDEAPYLQAHALGASA